MKLKNLPQDRMHMDLSEIKSTAAQFAPLNTWGYLGMGQRISRSPISLGGRFHSRYRNLLVNSCYEYVNINLSLIT